MMFTKERIEFKSEKILKKKEVGYGQELSQCVCVGGG